MGVGVHHQGVHVDPRVRARLAQQLPELVASHLADKGGPPAHFGQQRQHVARCAAGIGLIHQVSLGADPIAGEVDEKLSQGDYVELFFHD